MNLSSETVRSIERLREAAIDHGEVSDLLESLAACLEVTNPESDTPRLAIRNGEATVGDVMQIRAALLAAAFCAHDRSEKYPSAR